MKKLVSIFLTLAMIFSLSITAFAAEDTTLTIENSTGRTYVGYQLLKLSTSLKGTGHHTDHGDEPHNDDCYNYAYEIPQDSKYRTILQQEVYDNGGNYLWEGGQKPTSASSITDDQILKYLSHQKTDTANYMPQVADRLYRAIKAANTDTDDTNNIAPDAPNLTGSNDTIAQGYWMIVDVSNLNGNEANSLVMVDTKGQDALTITPKTALPTVEKKVKDIEDSEDNSILDNGWHDSADHDIGDKVPFKLTATLPSNAQHYQSYTMIFHDTLSDGLTLDPGSFKVLMYETKYKADVDTDLNDSAEDVTTFFTVPNTATQTFAVGCNNVYAIEGVTKDTAFVVYYEATLNENAVIGIGDDPQNPGNPNEVYLEFSNEPYGIGTGKTETDKVVVFTYQVIVNKTDSHGHPLNGAGFTLSKKNIDGTYSTIGDELKGDDMTTFTWTGLDDGDYKLVESTVPAGYNKMSDILFTITAVHNATLESLEGGLMGPGDVDAGTITKDIINNTGTVLPETGAQGTMMLIGGGAMFVIVAAVFMVTRKKMSVYEF